MSIMMSDSLKDIVSIGQLTGDLSEVTIDADGEKHVIDLYSFTRDKSTIRCLAFSPRTLVVKLIDSKSLHASMTFEGKQLGSGAIITLGYEPILIGEDIHNMLMVHVKRDN